MSSKEDHRVIFQKLEDLPVELDGKDPDPVSMMLNATDVIAEGDWFVHSKVRELVEANPQFTRPHISVDENSVTHAVKIILSQGPTMQPKGD